jgi:hypothetical protein
VQDLTAGDIKKYVTDEFNKYFHLKELAANDRVTSDQIMEEILEKAEGVSAHLFRGPHLGVLRDVRTFV